jgi:hypothetical protein
MLTVTEISEDSVTVFSTFFLIKNYQRMLDPNLLTQFSIFRTPTIDKEPYLTHTHYYSAIAMNSSQQ